MKAESLKYRPIYHVSSLLKPEADQKLVKDKIEAYVPSKYLMPPPKAVNPLLLSAPVLGESQ